MLYFDNSFAKGLNGVNHAEQFKHVTGQRRAFNRMQEQIAALHGNAAAVIPQDVYKEFDNQTKMLMRSNNHTLMNDLMPFAKALPVGKIEHVYRRASDSGIVQTSISGMGPQDLDKAAYDYDSTIKVIHQTAFGREWMEMEGQRTEGFDGLVDDQANGVRAVQDAIASHFIDGVSGVSFKGYTPDGIKNSSKVQAVDLDSSGLNVDFSSTSTTAANFRAGWISMDNYLSITNNVSMGRDYYVSREIFSNMKRFYSDNDVGFGTIYDAIVNLPGVLSVKEDASLSGNQVIGMARDPQFIRPLVGMAVATVPLARQNPFDNYNFIVWANVGLEIKTDYTGKKGVLYARAIA